LLKKTASNSIIIYLGNVVQVSVKTKVKGKGRQLI